MDEAVIKRIEALACEGVLNFSSAKVLAEEFGVKPRSIVTFATRKGLHYLKRGRSRRAITKDSIVLDIARELKVDPLNLTGLVSAPKSALTALFNVVVK